MKEHKIKSLISVFLILFCVSLSSCKISKNMLRGYSEVDFTTPQKLQISFNDHIYDTVVVLNNERLEINFSNEKALLDGAYVCLTDTDYKIAYKDMSFCGDSSELSPAFLPCIIYSFLNSFEEGLLLESYDEIRECYYVKKEVDGYFLSFECYEKNDDSYYSLEIK